jgi:hypothetical protein
MIYTEKMVEKDCYATPYSLSLTCLKLIVALREK